VTPTTTVFRILLADFELAAALNVLAFHGGAVLYPEACARLRDERERRRDGEQMQHIWMPSDVLNSLPSAMQRLLRENVVDELSLAA
jgi:hypothetical protein